MEHIFEDDQSGFLSRKSMDIGDNDLRNCVSIFTEVKLECSGE